MIYYVDIDRERRNTAGAKAPDDIAVLCQRRGYERIAIPFALKKKNNIFQRFWLAFVLTVHWIKVLVKLKRGDVIIYQHPFSGKRLAEKMVPIIQRKGCYFIALIHDLESLRGGIEGFVRKKRRTNELGDNILLKHFDAVICHNQHMKDYLVSKGFASERLFVLEIFDYLTDEPCILTSEQDQLSIAIAGNLASSKCGYIYKIIDGSNKENQSLKIYLFGNNYETDKGGPNMIYVGSFKPEELPGHLKGRFGLVWDGPQANTCAGNTGNYLRYNDPHKTSLYLTAGLPVIVWNEAAVADFVKENKVGLLITDLSDLEEKLCDISETEYDDMCCATKNISDKLRNGYYFYKALDECLRYINTLI